MNNPLQGVLGHLELMIAGAPPRPRSAPSCRRIYHDADRAAKIVSNLLVFTGSQRVVATGRRRRRGSSTQRSRSAQAGARRADVEIVQRGLDIDASSCIGDAGLLQQALLNVMINAEQAIADGTVAGGSIGHGLVRPTDRVIIEIEDTGPGIAPDVLPRIFDPFFTTKEVGTGHRARAGDRLRHRPGTRRQHHAPAVRRSAARVSRSSCPLPMSEVDEVTLRQIGLHSR